MKLYLSSYKLGNNPQQLADLIGKNKKIAVISNAVDFAIDAEIRRDKTDREIADLKNLVLDPEELDLRDYFGKPEELSNKASEFGAFWVRGGNTFILRRAYKQSGFDKYLISQKDNHDLVYAGYSAGCCILAPTLRGLETVDDPNIVPEKYDKEIVWDGIGLIDFIFVPHYRSNHPESPATEIEVENYKKKGINYKTVHDGEVLIYK